MDLKQQECMPAEVPAALLCSDAVQENIMKTDIETGEITYEKTDRLQQPANKMGGSVPEGTGERPDCAEEGAPYAEMAPGAAFLAGTVLTPLPAKSGAQIQTITRHYLEIPDADKAAEEELLMLNTFLPVSDEPYAANDCGNARRFLDRYSACVRYCPEEKRWYLFNGTKWAPVPVEEVQKRVRNALFQSHEEERAKLEAEHRYRDAAKSEDAKRSCGKMSNIKSCMEAAALDCFIHPQDFDADIYRFHTANGSIHLKSFEKTQFHKTGDFHTKTANASLREGSQDAQDDCPMWTRFVKQCCMYDDELYKYVQAAAGYSILTGDIREQKAFCLLGSGRNGKSLFINVLAYVAGDYAKKLESSVLCTDRFGKKSDETEKELYRIRGSRLVYSNEFSQSSILNGSFLKTITDGGRITCRTLYRESIEYTPTYTLWFSTNHMPGLQAMDEGIRRRIVVIPFRNHLREDEVDRNLEARLLSEADGILAWLLQGYLRYHHQGLVTPKAVIEATRGYFEEQDVFQRFLNENYEIAPDSRVKASELYQSYVDWCKRNGETAVSNVMLSRELERLGIEKRKESSGNMYMLKKTC